MDIILEVGKVRKVNFQCVGQPVINLEDLIQSNEMIIGDGFIHNQSKETLPDVESPASFSRPLWTRASCTTKRVLLLRA